LLRASGQHAGEAFAVETVLQGGETGVPHAAALIEYGEAVLGDDAARRARARRAVYEALGPAGLADAAAIVASFNAVVKLADGTGIPLEEAKAAATADLRAQLGLERFNRNAAAE
jgi:hypothetical protein